MTQNIYVIAIKTSFELDKYSQGHKDYVRYQDVKNMRKLK